MRTADDALYVAKEMGRNRVIRFDGDEFNTHQSENEGADAAPRPDYSASDTGDPSQR